MVGLARAFRTGTIVIGEKRFGLIRIPRFRPAEYPALCLAAWSTLHTTTVVAPTAAAIQNVIDAAWLREVADRLAAFRTERVDAVLVDVGGNGGGNDLGDWAARLFTSDAVHSAPLSMHTGPLAAKYMDEQLQGLNDALGRTQPMRRSRLRCARRSKRSSAASESRRSSPATCHGRGANSAASIRLSAPA